MVARCQKLVSREVSSLRRRLSQAGEIPRCDLADIALGCCQTVTARTASLIHKRACHGLGYVAGLGQRSLVGAGQVREYLYGELVDGTSWEVVRYSKRTRHYELWFGGEHIGNLSCQSNSNRAETADPRRWSIEVRDRVVARVDEGRLPESSVLTFSADRDQTFALPSELPHQPPREFFKAIGALIRYYLRISSERPEHGDVILRSDPSGLSQENVILYFVSGFAFRFLIWGGWFDIWNSGLE